MNTRSINTTKPIIQVAQLVTLCLALLPMIAIAHGGEEHVMGTVASVSDTSLTVKTAAGKSVEVMLDAKTTYTRADQPIQRTDIKVGDRVVIHAGKSDKKLVAHTVQIGTATGTKQAAKH